MGNCFKWIMLLEELLLHDVLLSQKPPSRRHGHRDKGTQSDPHYVYEVEQSI